MDEIVSADVKGALLYCIKVKEERKIGSIGMDRDGLTARDDA